MDVYFDNASTTKMYDAVCEHIDYINRIVMQTHLQFYSFGLISEKVIKDARELLLILLVNKDEIYFTSEGTESNNLAILGYSLRNKIKETI